MIKVQFNDVDEWLEELMRMTEAGVVRVCVVTRTSEKYPGSLYFVSVLAGAINESGQLVELSVPCGNALRHAAEGDNASIAKANELAQSVRERAKALGLDVRSGRFLAAEASPC